MEGYAIMFEINDLVIVIDDSCRFKEYNYYGQLGTVVKVDKTKIHLKFDYMIDQPVEFFRSSQLQSVDNIGIGGGGAQSMLASALMQIQDMNKKVYQMNEKIDEMGKRVEILYNLHSGDVFGDFGRSKE
jgi:hypothetical protein